jgi:DNA-binding transcriptional MerR regulator
MPKKTQEIPLILRGDNFAIDFADYCFADDPRMKKFQSNVREKKFKVSDTDVKYRVVNHWEEKGLLPDNLRKDSEGWRRFSFVEFIWLKVVEQLRSFGVPTDVIKNAKDRIMDFDKGDNSYLLFEYYVAKARASTLDPYVVVTQNGLSDVGSLSEIESMKSFHGNQSYILISLKNIMEELGLKVTKPEVLFSLTKEEVEILCTLRLEDVDSIKIRMKNGKINEIDTDKVFSGINLNKLKKEIGESGDYADITARFEKGKEQSVKVSKKKKV